MNEIPAPPPPPLSLTRRFFATGLSLVTLGCALLYWLGYAFVTAQVVTGVYGGPELLIVVVVFTFPVALLCTIIAVILAGWTRSKLAWVSLSSFAWPFILVAYLFYYSGGMFFK